MWGSNSHVETLHYIQQGFTTGFQKSITGLGQAGSRWKKKPLQIKGEFYRYCEFSRFVLNCSLKPAFVSVQPLQSLTLEPLTLSRVLQPHLSMPRWQKKLCLLSSETTTFSTFTVHPIRSTASPLGPEHSCQLVDYSIDSIPRVTNFTTSTGCELMLPPEDTCGGVPGVEMMGGK